MKKKVLTSLMGTIFFVLVLLIFGCKQKETILTGSIFIVTEGGENIKLGLVSVDVYDSIEISKFFHSREPKMKRRLDSLNGLDSLAGGICEQKKLEWDSAQSKTESALNLVSADKGGSAFDKYLKLNKKEDSLFREWNNCTAAPNEWASDLADLKSGRAYIFDLPTPLMISKTDADGKFAVKLPVGNYGIIATTSRKAGEYDETYYWLIWKKLTVDSNTIMLSNDNLFSTHCRECIF